MVERLAYRVPEAAEAIGVSDSKFWAWVSEGRIQTVKDGNITLVTRQALEAFLASLSPVPPSKKAAQS